MEIEFGTADHNGVEVASPYGRTQLVDVLKELLWKMWTNLAVPPCEKYRRVDMFVCACVDEVS